MPLGSRIRHSVIGWGVRKVLHAGYSLRHRNGQPVGYRLPGGVDIRLFPEGEIAEFLWIRRLFEKTEMALAAAYLRPGMKVIDVGANVGVYSILAQQRVGQDGSVWAFEPSSESYGRLLRNISLNGCHSVRPVQMALGDRPGRLALQSDAGFGDAYRYLCPSKEANGNGSEFVPVMPLDVFACRNGIARADYMKVDVEGCEYMVFAGSRDLLASSPGLVIMFESEPEWCERAGCRQQDTFELLRALGFGLFAWDHRERKWNGDEAAIVDASTVWASRDPGVLPVL
jgi:FkbM family methyltransferase